MPLGNNVIFKFQHTLLQHSVNTVVFINTSVLNNEKILLKNYCKGVGAGIGIIREETIAIERKL